MENPVSPSTKNGENLESANLIVFFFRWKWPILGLCFLAAIVSSIASFMIEEKYKSTVVMYATPQNSFGEQLLEDVKKQDLLEYGEKEDAERLLQVLNSDVIQGKIIEKYDLWSAYDIQKDEKGANSIMQKEYASNVSSKLTRFGSVNVDVMDKDPIRARDMANDIAALADTVTNNLRKERAYQAFKYTETSYESLLEEIRLLEDSINVLRELGVYDYITQIEGLNEQYATALAKGQPKYADQLMQKMKDISAYGSIYAKLETLIESAYEREAVLKKRFELMKIDVEAQLPAKYVVDYASVADKKSYPVRWLIVAMSVISVFLFSVVFIMLVENFRKLKAAGKL